MLSLFNRAPVKNVAENDLLKAAANKRWKLALRIVKAIEKNSKINQAELNNTLLIAIQHRQHGLISAILDKGGQADCMDGRMLVEAAINADNKSIRLLVGKCPLIIRYTDKARHAVFQQWADIPGGDGAVYVDTANLLDQLKKQKTVILARARKKHLRPWR